MAEPTLNPREAEIFQPEPCMQFTLAVDENHQGAFRKNTTSPGPAPG